MSFEFEIVGQSARVLILVLGYENPEAQNTSDANWLSCHVNIHVGSFSGQVDAPFTTSDFVAFGESLRGVGSKLNGVAVLETDENALKLSLEVTRTGVARVSGVLRATDGSQTSLVFSFESDQTFVAQTVIALDELARCFPVRE